MLFFFFGMQGLSLRTGPTGGGPSSMPTSRAGSTSPSAPASVPLFKSRPLTPSLPAPFLEHSTALFLTATRGSAAGSGSTQASGPMIIRPISGPIFGGNNNFSYNALGFQNTGGSFTETATAPQTYTKVIPTSHSRTHDPIHRTNHRHHPGERQPEQFGEPLQPGLPGQLPPGAPAQRPGALRPPANLRGWVRPCSSTASSSASAAASLTIPSRPRPTSHRG